MAAKKQNHKPQGHYCKVCDTYKANEKFSGKGHAAHVCKACMALPPDERSEQMTLSKIEGMAFRYLSDSEVKWLRSKMNDQRPGVRDAAIEAHRIKFPHYERNMAKKGLIIRSLDFFIHGEIWDEWGDEVSVHMRFFADQTGLIRRIDYDAPEHERESEIRISPQEARKFLKAVIHELNAPFWAEDLSDADPSVDILPDYRDSDCEDIEDELLSGTEEEKARLPLWSVSMEMNKGGQRKIVFYHQLHDESQGLFLSLNSIFEPDEDVEFADMQT